MQEPNEAEFHDRVREVLGAYRPEPRPEDWGRMRRALRRRQWWRLGIVGMLCVLSGLLAGKWLAETQSREMSGTVVTDTAPAPPTHEQPEPYGEAVPAQPDAEPLLLPEDATGGTQNPVSPGRGDTYGPVRESRQRAFRGVALKAVQVSD